MGLEEEVMKVLEDNFPWLTEVDEEWVTNPQRKVAGLLVAILLYIAASIANVIELAMNTIIGPTETVSSIVADAYRQFFSPILLVMDEFNSAAADLAGAGPLAPFFLLVLYMAEMYLLYLLVKQLYRAIVVLT